MRLPLLTAVLSLAAGIGQDVTPPPPPLPGGPVVVPHLDAQGQPLVPGVLPKDTAKDAVEAWERICKAHLAPGTERRAVSAFDVALDLRYKASASQTNDFQARYRFLAPPGYLRATTESRREQIRGPQGDWLVDPASNEKLRLDIGRANEEDRRQLDESVAIAKNFVALFDPRSLRIVSLVRAPSAPTGLPPGSKARAEKCAWLTVVSPDFHLQRTKGAKQGSAPSAVRVLLGIDPETNLVAFALIHDGTARAELSETTLFIELARFKPLDGFIVPHHIRVYETEPARRPIAFRSEPSSDIYVVEGKANLRAPLVPTDFVP